MYKSPSHHFHLPNIFSHILADNHPAWIRNGSQSWLLRSKTQKTVIFSGKDLAWTEIYKENMNIDRVAKIPQERVADFIKGEELNPDAPCSFRRKQSKPPSTRAL